jgi:hypothetical protein
MRAALSMFGLHLLQRVAGRRDGSLHVRGRVEPDIGGPVPALRGFLLVTSWACSVSGCVQSAETVFSWLRVVNASTSGGGSRPVQRSCVSPRARRHATSRPYRVKRFCFPGFPGGDPPGMQRFLPWRRVRIARAERSTQRNEPPKEAAMTNKNMKKLVAAVTRNDNTYWTQIGVAFENRDHSWNLKFDYLPTDLQETTIQLRDFDPKSDDSEAQRR